MKLKRASTQKNAWDKNSMFGANLSFAASEAYKLLRTNILFSFAETGCHVLGVTSAVSGEGKSLTACNLAASLSEAGKKTLLLDGDLRLPTIATKLELPSEHGLTELLISHDEPEAYLRHCSEAGQLAIITAGAAAPNPSELLGSARMAELIEKFRTKYDYVIVDLPPVTEVSDTQVIAKLLDGVIVVVRDGVAEESRLAAAMRQLKLVELRVLGFVYNCGSGGSGKHYKSYYRHYGERRSQKT